MEEIPVVLLWALSKVNLRVLGTIFKDIIDARVRGII